MKYTPTFLALGLSIGCLGYTIGFVPAFIVIVFLFFAAHSLLHLLRF